MSGTKKNVENSVENVDNKMENFPENNSNSEKNVDITENNDVIVDALSLADVSQIVNSVVDNCFQERNGKLEFSSEYCEVLKAYWKLSFFVPSLKITEISIFEFFEKYIAGKYDSYLREIQLFHDKLPSYIDNAIDEKIKFKIAQIQNPLVNSLANLCEVISATVEKYSENIESTDLKKMIDDFADFTKKNNPETITNTVLNKHLDKMRKSKRKPIEIKKDVKGE